MNKLLKIKLKPIEHVVCAAIRFTPPDNLQNLYQVVNDTELFEFAQQNRVESIVAHSLIESLGAVQTPAHWREAHEQTTKRISDYMAKLDELSEHLAQKGVELIALKNGGIARAGIACIGCVPMGDIDLLIKEKDFNASHQTLFDLGYTLCFRNPLIINDLASALVEGGGEYWKILPSSEKFWLELQWRAVAGRWINKTQEPDSNELFSRSRSIAETKVRLLCPEDNLLQVCLHTAKHSYVRAPGIRLHLDVDRIVNYYSIDWKKFIAMAINAQIKTAVYFSLLMPKILFETPIPDEVLKSFHPGTIKTALIARLIVRAGIFNPDKQKFSRFVYVFLNVLLYDNYRQLTYSILSKVGNFSQLKDLVFKRINT